MVDEEPTLEQEGRLSYPDVVMYVEQLVYILLVIHSDGVVFSWNSMRKSRISADVKLLNQYNKKKLPKELLKSGSLKCMRRVLYQLHDFLAKKHYPIGKALLEAEKITRNCLVMMSSYIQGAPKYKF